MFELNEMVQYKDHTQAFVILLNNLAPSYATCFGAGSCCLVLWGSSPDASVKYVVVLIPLPHEDIMEESAKIGVVRLVVEAKSTGVVQEDPKFIWGSTAEKVGRGGHFLLHDAIVFLLLGGSFETLPGKGNYIKISKRFEVIIEIRTALSNAHQVIWLDVSMYEVAGVDILNARNLSRRVSED